MPGTLSIGPSSYPGPLPAAPTPPAAVPTALPAGTPVPTLGVLTIIVAGDSKVTSNTVGATIVKR